MALPHDQDPEPERPSGNGRVPPPQSTHALTSFVEGESRVLALKLPMPFTNSAELTFTNTSDGAFAFELGLEGERSVPAHTFGRLHVQRRDTVGPTQELLHVAVQANTFSTRVESCASAPVAAIVWLSAVAAVFHESPP